MKKINALIFLFTAMSVFSACENEIDRELHRSGERAAGEPAVSPEASAENALAATTRIVSLSAVKMDCNRYKLTVTLNQPVCKRNPSGYIVGYWTLFSGAEGKRISLPQTRSDNCLSGTQFTIDYTPSKNTLVKIVLLPFEPVGYLFSGYLESNTVSLKTGC